MNIKENVENLRTEIEKLKLENNIKKDIIICAATKYVGVNEMREIISCGINNLGENRVDSFLQKYEQLKDESIVWHFIGSLQTNKVKKIINKIDYLHSLDRESLAREIEKYRENPLDCFVEVNCSGESSKHGLSESEVIPFINSLKNYKSIRIIGLMTMAENTQDFESIKGNFRRLKMIQEEIISINLDYAPCSYLSMGMSNDFKEAIIEGATLVRIGSRLFK